MAAKAKIKVKMIYDVNLSINKRQSAPNLKGERMKIVSEEEIKTRIENKYSNQPFKIIGYYDINHIDSILSKWFNDYSEKK